MNDIKFTIITASYNYEEYIKETIESVINQTYSNWEMLIIDDGSKDNSIEVINSYTQKDERIKLLTHENNQNKGLVETVKLGINKAKTQWLVFLESDDTITPNYLERKLEIIKKNPEVGFIYNAVNAFGDPKRVEQLQRYFKVIKETFSKIQSEKKQLEIFKDGNIVPTFSCVAIKKELFNGVSFDSPIKAALDYFLWMQIARKTSFYYLDEKLTNWRMHESYTVKRKISPLQSVLFNFFVRKFTFCPKIKFFAPFQYIYIYIRILLDLMIYFRKSIFRFSAKERKITLFGRVLHY